MEFVGSCELWLIRANTPIVKYSVDGVGYGFLFSRRFGVIGG
jgi:hypothetical protein